MSGQITITVSRVTKGRDWADHQQQDAADLEAQLREHAERNSLVVIHVSGVTIHRSDSGSWARLVRTATAHHRAGPTSGRRASRPHRSPSGPVLMPKLLRRGDR